MIRIKELNLSNNPLTNTGVNALSKALHPGYENIQTLKKLNLSGTGIGTGEKHERFGIADALANMGNEYNTLYSNIEELDLSNNKLGKNGMNDLAHFASIIGNPNLKKLNLSNNKMEDDDVTHLNMIMDSNLMYGRDSTEPGNSINELNLSNTDITDNMFRNMSMYINNFINRGKDKGEANIIDLSNNKFSQDFKTSIMKHESSANIILKN